MDQHTNTIIQEIAQVIIDTSGRQRKDFHEENLILQLCCRSPDTYPHAIAEQYNLLVKNAQKTKEDIMNTFSRCRLGSIEDRILLFKQSRSNAQQIADAIERNELKNIETIRPRLESHIQARRLVLLSLGYIWRTSLTDEANRSLLRMNRDFSNECMDSILDLIIKRGNVSEKEKRVHLTAEAYEKEIYRLNVALNRANNLVTRLQDSYEEQMMEIRAEEEIRIISMLNSEKYGFILDLLLSAQDGFRQLRKKGAVPFEIKNVQSLIRRLLEFVDDCNIVPILEVGEQLLVQADELDGYSYEGTPFTGSDDTKQVEVVSPGWRVQEKEIVISYPRVKEVMEEN